MIRARRVAAHAQPAHDLSCHIVERHAATESDDPSRDSVVAPSTVGSGEGFRVEGVGIVQAKKRMAWLAERVQPGRGERQGVQAKSIRRVRFGLGNSLAARPSLGSVCRGGVFRAEFSRAIHHYGPHSLSAEEPPWGRPPVRAKG